jgi:hypothetical protein
VRDSCHERASLNPIAAQRAFGARTLTAAPTLRDQSRIRITVRVSASRLTSAGVSARARVRRQSVVGARRSARNDIWLCRTRARVVDEDTQRYTSRVFRFRKMDVEEFAARENGRAVPSLLPIRFALIRLDSPRFMWIPAHRLHNVAASLGDRHGI